MKKLKERLELLKCKAIRWYFFLGFKWNFFWMWLPLIKKVKGGIWNYWKPRKDFNLLYTELNKIEDELAKEEKIK